MKLKFVTLFATLMATSLISNAQLNVVTANFQGGASGLAIVDNAGFPIAVDVFVGTFGAGADFNTVTLDDFNQLGGSLPQFQPGLFNGAFPDAIIDATNSSIFVGSPAQVVATGDFGSGPDFVVFDIGQVFQEPDPNIPATSDLGSTFFTEGGQILRGEETELQGELFNPAFVFTTAVTAPIPEPSAALLAGLALVGGLVRRRR